MGWRVLASGGFIMRLNGRLFLLLLPLLAVASAYLTGLFDDTLDQGALLSALALFLSALLFLLAGGQLLQGGARTIGNGVLWGVIFAAGVTLYMDRDQVRPLQDRVHSFLRPSVALTSAPGEAMLRRTWDGHYRAEALVNGIGLTLMIDTGASIVLLPYEEMQALGIDPGTLDYSMKVTTANGPTTVAPIRLASIRIGPIAAHDVDAAVAHPGKLKIGLLGLSFMDRLSEISFRGETLTLKM